jgi:hypothetical protein
MAASPDSICRQRIDRQKFRLKVRPKVGCPRLWECSNNLPVGVISCLRLSNRISATGAVGIFSAVGRVGQVDGRDADLLGPLAGYAPDGRRLGGHGELLDGCGPAEADRIASRTGMRTGLKGHERLELLLDCPGLNCCFGSFRRSGLGRNRGGSDRPAGCVCCVGLGSRSHRTAGHWLRRVCVGFRLQRNSSRSERNLHGKPPTDRIYFLIDRRGGNIVEYLSG